MNFRLSIYLILWISSHCGSGDGLESRVSITGPDHWVETMPEEELATETDTKMQTSRKQTLASSLVRQFSGDFRTWSTVVVVDGIDRRLVWGAHHNLSYHAREFIEKYELLLG